MIYYWIPPHLRTFSTEKSPKYSSMSVNFVGNTLTQSDTIESCTPYDVTTCSSRPPKTTIAFFVEKGIRKLFYNPDQTLNSKIMNQCNIDFNFLE